MICAIVWGSSFVAQTTGAEYVGPFTFISLRSLLGSVVLAGVELAGVLVEELTDGAGHGKTQVGVDVDLADAKRRSLTQQIGRAHV